jgi:hypothetical protein
MSEVQTGAGSAAETDDDNDHIHSLTPTPTHGAGMATTSTDCAEETQFCTEPAEFAAESVFADDFFSNPSSTYGTRTFSEGDGEDVATPGTATTVPAEETSRTALGVGDVKYKLRQKVKPPDRWGGTTIKTISSTPSYSSSSSGSSFLEGPG